MGTVVTFDIRDPGGADALAGAVAVLHAADREFSTYKPDSALSRLRRGELPAGEIGQNMRAVEQYSEVIKHMTDGWFDPWSMPGGYDPTGVVKGWAAAGAARVLAEAGVRNALVNAAGDIAALGAPGPQARWRIGIQDPRDSQMIVCVLELLDGETVATSGAYERGEHILMPNSGAPSRACLSATVKGPDLTIADGMATALFAAGPAGLRFVERAAGYEGLVIGLGGETFATGGLDMAPLAPSR